MRVMKQKGSLSVNATKHVSYLPQEGMIQSNCFKEICIDVKRYLCEYLMPSYSYVFVLFRIDYFNH